MRDTGIEKSIQHIASRRRISAWHGLVIILTAIAILIPMSATVAASWSPPYAEQSRPASSKLWNTEIYVIDVDGSNERNLTQNPADDSALAWSPDGKKIAFVSNRDGGQAIYVMNADSTGILRLAESITRISSLTWSPNSKEIAMVSSNELNVISSERAGNGRKLVSGTEMVGVSWSPDSKKIAFSGKPVFMADKKLPTEYWARDNSKTEIYIINITASNLSKLTYFPEHWAQWPAWSPDGEDVAFFATGYLTVMDSDGKNWVTLSSWGPIKGQGTPPRWSHDGKKIVFEGRDGKIHIIDVETGSEDMQQIGRSPTWSPDRKRLAFMRDGKIHVIDIASGKETTLAEGGYPAWSPDGKKIAFVKVAMPPIPTSPSVGSWTHLAPVPSIMWNSVFTWDGGDNIYAYSGTINQYGPYRSDTDRQFYRLSISGNSWSPIAAIPDNNAQPRGLIWLAGEGLYTFDNGKDVWFYHPSSASWKRVTPFPGKNYISSIGVTRAGNKYIYVHDEDSFWQYSVSNDSWETVAEGLWCPPNPTAMVWTGGDFIYGFSASSQESGERAFWRYSISSNQWSALPMPPGQVAVSEKVHLAWGGSDYIYLYGGGSRTTPHLWRYSILGDTWEALEPLPEDQMAAMVATSSGLYVAPGGTYSELLGGAPSWFYFSPSPAPISVPGVPQEINKVSVHLYGQKTQVTVDEDVILELSAVNLITNPTMTVQLILQVPPGMSVTSTAFVEAGAGQYTATYAVEPGYARQIEVHIRANQTGSFNIVGYLAYYLGVDKSTAEYRTVNMLVKVASDKASAETITPQPSRKGIGFLSCSGPAEGALPPSAGELLAGWFPIGLTWGCLGICYSIVKRRRRKNRFDQSL